MEASVVDVLLDAKNHIADPERWITGADCRVTYGPEAKKAYGENGAYNDQDLMAMAPSIKQIIAMDDEEFTLWTFCMRGAVGFACINLDQTAQQTAFSEAMSELGLTIRAMYEGQPWRIVLANGYGALSEEVPSFNDGLDDTDIACHRRVMEIFDDTIARLKDHGPSFRYDFDSRYTRRLSEDEPQF